MAALAESLIASSARRLRVRIRPDLSFERQFYQGQVSWIVKDPIGLNYFRLKEQEYALINMLDGKTSLDQIQEHLDAQFPPTKFTLEDVARLIGNLHQNGLVISDILGQGHQLKKRQRKKHGQQLRAKFSSVLAIRFRGVDPERFLTWLYPQVRWLFTPAALFVYVATCLAALSLITVQFDVFRSKLPGFQEFFRAENWFWFILVLGITKVIHELGHGLACKHFGGECHEIGVMILVLTPCLYCNVSDSWMLPNKWHRAAIGAAGIFIELMLASVATFLWWFSEPGLINQLCLSVMFVCSVSTVLFNGNPLLRYDGYYVLADVLEIPNLRQKAGSILMRKLGAWCLGLEEPEDSTLPQERQWLFALYTVASIAYRWLVVLGILFFLYKVFEPYGLKIFGQIIAAAALYGLLVQPLWKFAKFMNVPGRIQKVNRLRFYSTIGAVAGIVAFVVWVPLPHHVICSLEVQPRGAAKVFVEVPGALRAVHVRVGDRVEKEKVLAELDNVDVRLEEARYRGRFEEYSERLTYLKRERYRRGAEGLEAGRQIPEAREARASAHDQWKQKTKELARLKVRSPVAGVVLPPSLVSGKPKAEGMLATWSGTPLSMRNRDSFITEGTLFCQVGDPRHLEALLVVDQSDIEFVRVRQSVEIVLDGLPFDTLFGKITEIADQELLASSTRLSAKGGGDLITKTDESGRERPVSTSYQARVPLADVEGVLRIGLVGRAKISTPPQTLGQRLWRFLSRTFNFEL